MPKVLMNAAQLAAFEAAIADAVGFNWPTLVEDLLNDGTAYFGLSYSLVEFGAPISSGVAPTLTGGAITQSGPHLVITPPTATGTPTPTVTFVGVTRDDEDITDDLDVLTIPDFVIGTYKALFTATNGVAPDASRELSGSFTAPDDVTLATTTMLSSVSFRDVTFTFDRPMPVCYSCLGEPAVISTEAFNVTSISPASAVVDGFVANGAELNPGDKSNEQGFDAIVAETGPGSDNGTQSSIVYNPALNVDPGVSGNLAFAAGGSGSVVKSVRVEGFNNPSGTAWQAIDRYVVLSVLPTVPPAGFFRPGMAGTNKAVPSNRREGAVNYGALRNLPAISGGYTQAQAEAAILPTSPLFGTVNKEKLRRLDLEEAVPNSSNYSRAHGLTRGDAFTFLHTNGTNAEKRLTYLRCIQHGHDMHNAISQNGYTGIGGAGQHYGEQFFTYAAAFALNDADILASAQAQFGGPLGQHGWVKPEDVGQFATYPGGGGDDHFNNATYFASDIGVPEWLRDATNGTPGGVPEFPGTVGNNNAAPSARYRDMHIAGQMEALAVALLQAGPGGLDGVQAILAAGPFDNSNYRAAALAFYDRYRLWPVGNPWRNTNYLTQPRADAWDTRRPLLSVPLWTGRPDWVDATGQVTAGDGAIAYDWSAHIWATEPITRRDVRYSLDGVQWVEQTGVAAAGTLSGLLRGVAHHVGFRLVSASGPGRWSPTWPKQGALGTAPGLRNAVSPTGTAAATAPVNTVAPVIHIPMFALWDGPEYEPAPANLTTAFMGREKNRSLFAGAGYWTGFPAPTLTYQWVKNDSPIPDATNKSYLPDWFADQSGAIACDVTGANGNGSPVTVRTAAVNIPAQVEPAAPTVFTRAANNGTGILRRSSALVGVSAGRQGTFAFRGRLTGGDGTFRTLLAGGPGSSVDAVRIELRSTNFLRVLLKSAVSGTTHLQHDSTGFTFNQAAGDFSLLCAWDLTAGVSQIYVNGVNRGATPATLINGDVGYQSPTTWALLATAAATPGTPASAELDYMMLHDEFIDLSVSGNRAVFDDPAAMGAWGRGPNGNRPPIFTWGNAATWNDGAANKGDGGSFPAFSATFS